MIPRAAIIAWSVTAPWPSENHVEQDLILSRLLIEIASDPLLSEELAFRGGTCLHKLHLQEPQRYSEDLDFVRTNQHPILGDIFDRFRAITEQIGLREHRRTFPSQDSDTATMWFDTDAESEATTIRVKIEYSPPRFAHFVSDAKDETSSTSGSVSTCPKSTAATSPGRSLTTCGTASTATPSSSAISRPSSSIPTSPPT